MPSYEIPKPPARPSRQEAEIKSKINLVLDGVAPDKTRLKFYQIWPKPGKTIATGKPL